MTTAAETMMKTVLRAMGFNAETFTADMQKFVTGVVTQLQNFQVTLDAINLKSDRILDRLDMLTQQVPPATSIDVALLPPPLDGATVEMETMQ